MKKKTINTILILIIISFSVWLGFELYNDQNVKKQNREEVYLVQKTIANNIEQAHSYPKEKVETEYKGYTVAAKLEIPEIELETCVLQNYSENALNVSVTKFWGCNPNETGNFCIVGHNFKNKNMFKNLRNLKKGDLLYLIDNKVGKVTYEIYDIYKVVPEDVSCLSQETNGKKEVTLITCTSDSKMRIIVKSVEK